MSGRIEVTESCRCGATVAGRGLDGFYFRKAHAACREAWVASLAVTKPPPGPCWHDSGVTWPGEAQSVRCELLAGHDGAHTAKRPNGGESVWTETAPTATSGGAEGAGEGP